jgi:hypothetical protein
MDSHATGYGSQLSQSGEKPRIHRPIPNDMAILPVAPHEPKYSHKLHCFPSWNLCFCSMNSFIAMPGGGRRSTSLIASFILYNSPKRVTTTGTNKSCVKIVKSFNIPIPDYCFFDVSIHVARDAL